MNQQRHTQTRHDERVLLLDLLDQAFPGQIDVLQEAKERFDKARLAQARAIRTSDSRQVLASLDEVDQARRALQQAILRLGISLIQYTVGVGHDDMT